MKYLARAVKYSGGEIMSESNFKSFLGRTPEVTKKAAKNPRWQFFFTNITALVLNGLDMSLKENGFFNEPIFSDEKSFKKLFSSDHRAIFLENLLNYLKSKEKDKLDWVFSHPRCNWIVKEVIEYDEVS
jgi:hypothetical protein